MKHKDIKRKVIEQRKKECPNWKRLARKEKKKLAEQVTKAVCQDYDFSQDIEVSKERLLGIQEQTQLDGILPLDEIGKLVDKRSKDPNYDKQKILLFRKNIKDPLLRYLNEILDDYIDQKPLEYPVIARKEESFCYHNWFVQSFLRQFITQKYPTENFARQNI